MKKKSCPADDKFVEENFWGKFERTLTLTEIKMNARAFSVHITT